VPRHDAARSAPEGGREERELLVERNRYGHRSGAPDPWQEAGVHVDSTAAGRRRGDPVRRDEVSEGDGDEHIHRCPITCSDRSHREDGAVPIAQGTPARMGQRDGMPVPSFVYECELGDLTIHMAR